MQPYGERYRSVCPQIRADQFGLRGEEARKLATDDLVLDEKSVVSEF
jgi:hypothetical protein